MGKAIFTIMEFNFSFISSSISRSFLLLITLLLTVLLGCKDRGTNELDSFSMGTPPAPKINSESEPILEPTYSSLRHHLIEKSCLPCHALEKKKGGLSFESYEKVRENAGEIYDLIRDREMPPPRSDRPKPSQEVIDTFEEWMNRGYPES